MYPDGCFRPPVRAGLRMQKSAPFGAKEFRVSHRRTHADSPTSSTLFFRDIVRDVAARSGLPQKIVERVLRDLAQSIYDALGQRKIVQWSGFGRFDVMHRFPRRIPHPSIPGRSVTIGGDAPRFKPGTAMRRSVAKRDTAPSDEERHPHAG